MRKPDEVVSGMKGEGASGELKSGISLFLCSDMGQPGHLNSGVGARHPRTSVPGIHLRFKTYRAVRMTPCEFCAVAGDTRLRIFVDAHHP